MVGGLAKHVVTCMSIQRYRVRISDVAKCIFCQPKCFSFWHDIQTHMQINVCRSPPSPSRPMRAKIIIIKADRLTDDVEHRNGFLTKTFPSFLHLGVNRTVSKIIVTPYIRPIFYSQRVPYKQPKLRIWQVYRSVVFARRSDFKWLVHAHQRNNLVPTWMVSKWLQYVG